MQARLNAQIKHEACIISTSQYNREMAIAHAVEKTMLRASAIINLPHIQH